MENRLSAILSKIHGAGDVTVMLTVQGGGQRVFAADETASRDADGSNRTQRTTVVVSKGSGTGESAVLVQELYPRIQGVLVVCPGGGKGEVKLKLMEAVSVLTGLGANKISICEGKG